MLSLKYVAPGAKVFFAYSEEGTHHSQESSEAQSQWQGKGAEKLGLSGTVNDDVFSLLMHGRLPDKTKFRHRRPTHANYKVRGALDLAFSAPKSVSLLTQIGGDKQLEQAHSKAISKAIDYIEKHYAMTRMRQQGKQLKVKTGNLVVAKFKHETSRLLDPQLYTRCLVLNMTQTSEGKWYSLNSDAIFENKLLLGTIYQNELAREAMELGYQIHRNGNNTFEIAGFKQEHLDYFSKRTKEIRPLIKQFNTWQEKQAACGQVRQTNAEVSRRELLAYWAKEAESIGLRLPQPNSQQKAALGNKPFQQEPTDKQISVTNRPLQQTSALETGMHGSTVELHSEQVHNRQQSGELVCGKVKRSIDRERGQQRLGIEALDIYPGREGELRFNATYPFLGRKAKQRSIAYDKPHSIFKTIDEAVAAGIDNAVEQSANFQPEQIMKFVLSELGGFNIDEIESAIDRAPGLIRFGQSLTTDDAAQRELDTTCTVQEQQGHLSPISSSEIVELHLKDFAKDLQQQNPHWRWTEGQLEAVKLATTSTDRFVAWQGVSGERKNVALQQASKIATNAGYCVRLFASTAKSAKVLSDELGIQGQTVAHLIRHEHKERLQQQLWIVEQAGLLSADAGQKLVHQAVMTNARVVFVGDSRQLSSAKPGNLFKSLQQAGMKTAYLEISKRHKHPGLKIAVNMAARGEIELSIKTLEHHGMIQYHNSRNFLHQKIVKDFLALSPEDRMNTLVIAKINKDREEISAGIRSGLRARGELGEKVAATQLVVKDLTDAQKKCAHNYEVGDVVISRSKAFGLEGGKRYQVIAIDDDRLRVIGNDRIYRVVKPSSNLSVFYVKRVDVSVGDAMQWQRNDMKTGRRIGQVFSIEAITGRMATVQYRDGSMEQLNLDEAQHFDYCAVITTCRSQKRKGSHVLMMVEDAGILKNPESYFKDISRAKYGVKVYAKQESTL